MLIWLLYFWCSIPFICSVSFFFNSSTKAYTFLICWNIIASSIFFIGTIFLSPYISTQINEYINILANIFLPSYALGRGVFAIALMCTVNELSNEEFPIWEALSFTLVSCMLISGLIFWLVLYIFQSKTIAFIFHQLFFYLHTNSYQIVSY